MTEVELFDRVKLAVDLPDKGLTAGTEGTVMELVTSKTTGEPGCIIEFNEDRVGVWIEAMPVSAVIPVALESHSAY